MPIQEIPFIKNNIITMRLERLVNFRSNLLSSLEKNSAINTSGDRNSEVLLVDQSTVIEFFKESSELKQKLDYEKFVGASLLKEINIMIDDLCIQFQTNKEFERDVMLLIERMKEVKKNDDDLRMFEEMQNNINKLENLERVKILILLGVMQALNEHLLYLDLELQKSYQSFTEDMVKVFDNAVKDDGTSLTEVEKEEINIDLVRHELALFESFFDLEEDKRENRSINNIIAKIRKDSFQAPSKDVRELILPMFKADKVDQDLVNKITSSDAFKKAHAVSVKENLARVNITNPDQVLKISDDRLEKMKSGSFLRKIFKIKKEKSSIKSALAKTKETFPDDTDLLSNLNLELPLDISKLNAPKNKN